jgi:hypothetical protein
LAVKLTVALASSLRVAVTVIGPGPGPTLTTRIVATPSLPVTLAPELSTAPPLADHCTPTAPALAPLLLACTTRGCPSGELAMAV